MKNRKNLHDLGLILIFFGVIDLFMFISTIITSFFDGTMETAFSTVEPEILLAVKIGVGIMGALMGLIVFADVILGIKALKVSEKPNADKGYIIVAKVFFVVSVLAVISIISTLVTGGGSLIDNILNLISTAMSIIVYVLFIRSAQAVRKDVLVL